MSVSIKNIKIPRNYVLVKFEPHYTTYQMNGRETGILTSDLIRERGENIKWAERHYSVYGEVFGVPDKIDFNKHKMDKLILSRTILNADGEKEQLADMGSLKEVAFLRKNGCRFDTVPEIYKGEKIRFSYRAHMAAVDNKTYFETEEGKMMFVKYDEVFLVVNEDLSPKRMVNGYILVKPHTKPVDRDEAMDYTTHGSFIIPKLGGSKSKEKRARKDMIGTVVLAGTRVNGYLDFIDVDPYDEIEPGDTLFFDPRGAKMLERDDHRIASNEDMYLIQRRQIYLNKNKNPNFDTIMSQKYVAV